jgi:hypothetical protein
VQRKAKGFEKISNMNDDQAALCLDGEKGDLIFVDAPGGTGKTFAFNSILKWVELRHGFESTISVFSSVQS